MAEQDAELFLPAHGLPITGRNRIRRVLTEVAGALEYLVTETLNLMNQGARLNDIVHSVSIDPAILQKPYLRPMYERDAGTDLSGAPRAGDLPHGEGDLQVGRQRVAGKTGFIKRAAAGPHRPASLPGQPRSSSSASAPLVSAGSSMASGSSGKTRWRSTRFASSARSGRPMCRASQAMAAAEVR